MHGGGEGTITKETIVTLRMEWWLKCGNKQSIFRASFGRKTGLTGQFGWNIKGKNSEFGIMFLIAVLKL